MQIEVDCLALAREIYLRIAASADPDSVATRLKKKKKQT